MYNNVVLSSTTNNPAVPKTDPFSPQPPSEESVSSTHYEALSAGVSVSRHLAADVSGPTYGNPYDDEQPAAAVTYEDYKREAMMPMSQLMPLYATHNLHHSISAYQHQLQQQQKQQQRQASDYTKTQPTVRQQSDAQGRCDWTIKLPVNFHAFRRLLICKL